MLFRQIFDPDLAQYAYLIGCQQTGEALIIDPERDVDRYLEIAASEGLRLVAAAETHIHADFLSGVRELVVNHGVTGYVSEMGTADWKVEWARTPAGEPKPDLPVQLLRDGDTIQIGKIEVQAVHTPGHTPEHLSYLVTDHGGGASTPIGIASGDFVFVGDLGRPDLLESAAGAVGAREPAARQLFASLPSFLGLSEELQVWPGHGAGSACGKALGAVPMSTVGYEKRYNASLRAARGGEQEFVDWILDAQPEPPAYFARMKFQNRSGPALLDTVPEPAEIALAAVLEASKRGAVVIDTRPSRKQFFAGHIEGSLWSPLGSSLAVVAGSYVAEESEIVLVCEPQDVDGAVRTLVRIGLDKVVGFVRPAVLADAPLVSTMVTDFAGVAQSGLDDVSWLDVRGAAEYREGHAAGAVQIAHTRLATRWDDLDRDKRWFVHCRSGRRAAFAAAAMEREGYDVVYVDDNISRLAGALGADQVVRGEEPAEAVTA